MTTATTTRTVTVSTKFGDKSIETSLNTTDAIKVIQDDPKASGFGLDLVYKIARWGLSPKQADWLVFLAQESINRSAKPAATVPASTLANVKPLFDLFARAHLNLKYPRLRLMDAKGRLVVVKLSGPGSKNCGSLNVTNGEKYGDAGAVFYGYVHQDGGVTIKDQGVLDLLTALASDPAGVAASQGLASGSCVFCGKSLSDSEAGSSEIGFGPVCAAHWNLPWERNGKAETITPVTTVKAKRVRKTVSV